MSTKLVFQGVSEAGIEDHGLTFFLDVGEDSDCEEKEVFVRIISNDDSEKHEEIKPLAGKRLKVTVEAFD